MKLKILSYNIHKGLSWPQNKIILPIMRQAIREIGAELVFLQEVIGNHLHEHRQIPNWKGTNQYEFLADTIWDHYSYAKNAVYNEGHHGNVILSKYPIIDSHQKNISTNIFEQRGILYSKIEIPFKGEVIHLMAYCLHLNLLHSGRKIQYDKIHQKIIQDSDLQGPLLVAGDFNDWNKKSHDIFEKQLKMKEVFKQLHGDYPKTFPSKFPTFCLDRIYVKNIKVISSTVLGGKPWNQLSDHLPILTEVEINVA